MYILNKSNFRGELRFLEKFSLNLGQVPLRKPWVIYEKVF